MTEEYNKLDEEYAEVKKEFDRAVKNKCSRCIDACIKKMARIDIEQAKILHQPLNSRPELNLNVRG